MEVRVQRRWLEIEALNSFDFEGTKVFVKLDVAFRDDDGRTVLIDWKTGRAPDPDHSMQVATYALYAAQAWGGAPTDVETRLAHLATGSTESVTLSEKALEAALSRIRASIRDMRQKLAPDGANVAQEADFPLVADPRTCRRCNFRRVCLNEGLIPPLSPPDGGRL